QGPPVEVGIGADVFGGDASDLGLRRAVETQLALQIGLLAFGALRRPPSRAQRPIETTEPRWDARQGCRASPLSQRRSAASSSPAASSSSPPDHSTGMRIAYRLNRASSPVMSTRSI